MVCPKCNHRMYVTDSRQRENVTYRRYRCNDCGSYLYTTERQDGTAKRTITKIAQENKEGGRDER